MEALALVPGALALAAGTYLLRSTDRERQANDEVLSPLIRPAGVSVLDRNDRLTGFVLLAFGVLLCVAGVVGTIVGWTG